jgi:hypothetical protein
MIDSELAARLDALEAKVDKAYHASETVRKYLFWTGIITIILVVVPAIGLAFAIPSFISSYTTTLNGLGY